jgi:hypothetical protein
VPFTIASIVLVATCPESGSAASVRSARSSGTMICAIKIAAGAPSTEAVMK